ncbi:hypothetical protein ACVWZ4_007216 [Bradyrhizobium sp. USDA 4472]
MTKYVIFLIASAGLFLWLDGYHVVRKPTPDQLYGCTIEQRAPNGECQ